MSPKSGWWIGLLLMNVSACLGLGIEKGLCVSFFVFGVVILLRSISQAEE